MDQLNARQLEAVQTTEGYLRVIAGAGSGKTRMLVNRYVYLIKELGISTKSVLCLTFSNKAANEMKTRIKKMLDTNADVSFVTTYHGLGARIIRDNCKKMFFPDKFQIIDQAAQKSILADIYDELGLKMNNNTFEELIEKIGAFKSDLKYISYMISTDEEQIISSEAVIARYLYHQKKYFLVDFEDLINYAIYLLMTFKEIREEWQEKINYVLVDEFQDSTAKELALVEYISGKYKNLLVVGDPDQNIYEWRGSKMELLADFDKTHYQTKTVIMDQNYRSTNQILTCANTLIAKNKNRLAKDLYTDAEGEKPIFYIAPNDFKEAEWIVQQIEELTKQHKERYSEIAILCRASYLFTTIESKLSDAKIPYEVYGSIKFFQRKEIQDIIAYIRLCVNEDDDALKRIINVPKRGFGKMSMRRLKNFNDGKQSLYQTLKERLDQLATSKIIDFVDMIETAKYNLTKGNLNALDLFDELLVKSGYDDYLRELGDMGRLNNLTELKRIIYDLLKDNPSTSLHDLLNYLSLQSDIIEEDVENVKLMTIHGSKGLEFNNVFIIGCCEGVFPSNKTIEERQVAGLEEERRLCYVAVTRARHRLFMSCSSSYYSDGSNRSQSRFIDEMGENNITIIGKKLVKTEKDNFYYEFAVDDRVKHNVLGEGTIIEIDRKNRSYKIQFDKIEYPRFIQAGFSLTKIEAVDPDEIYTNVKTEDNTTYIAAEDACVYEATDEVIDPEATDEVIDPDEIIGLSITESEEVKPFTYSFTNEKIDLSDVGSLWDDPNVPKTGWNCIGITDLGYPSGNCQMCNNATIRYVHHMRHNNYYKVLGVGCVCASKMEMSDDAVRREHDFKNRMQRLKTFLKKKFKRSRNGNEYIKVKDDIYCLYTINKEEKTTYVVYANRKRLEDNFINRNDALIAMFEEIEKNRE